MKISLGSYRKSFILLLFGVQALGLSSCFVQKNLTIQVLTPPDTVLFGDAHNLLLINAMLEGEQLKDTLKFDELRFPALAYNQLTWKTLYGFADVASGSPWVDKIIFDSVPYIRSSQESYHEIQIGYTLKHHTPVSILLHPLIFGDSLVRLNEFFSLEGDPGKMMYGVYLYLPVHSGWTVYRTGQGFYNYSVNDTVILQGFGESYRDAVAGLPDIRQNLWELVYHSGSVAAHKLYPVWEDVNRVYMIHLTNKEMVRAEIFAQQNQWMDAAEVWKKLAASKHKNLAAVAAFNMALAAEISDHLDVAADWLEKSYALKPKKITLDYLKIIRQRLKDQAKMHMHR